MAYVYRHIRLDTGKPFYIGMGRDNNYQRSRSLKNRNKYWKNIANKAGYEIEIIVDEISSECAIAKEIEFIGLYGRLDMRTGILVNMTDGGEGLSGLKHSKETCRKMSQSRMGIYKGRFVSDETRSKLSAAAKGKSNYLGKKHSEETKRKIGLKSIGRKHTEETRAIIGLASVRMWKNKQVSNG